MGAWKWATRVFALIGAMASLVTIIAWATSGAVSYPVIIVPPPQTSTVTVTASGTTAHASTVTNTFTMTVTTNNRTLVSQVASLQLRIVTVSGFAKATGQYATAKTITFQATLVNGQIVSYGDSLNSTGYYSVQVLNNQTYTVTIGWVGLAGYTSTSTAGQSPFKVTSTTPTLSQDFTV